MPFFSYILPWLARVVIFFRQLEMRHCLRTHKFLPALPPPQAGAYARASCPHIVYLIASIVWTPTCQFYSHFTTGIMLEQRYRLLDFILLSISHASSQREFSSISGRGILESMPELAYRFGATLRVFDVHIHAGDVSYRAWTRILHNTPSFFF